LIKSIAITNKIVIEASKNIFENLRNRDDIETIYIEIPQFVLCANTWNVEKINAHQVWSTVSVDGTGVKVGVLDTGNDYNHTDLHANIWNNLSEDVDGDGHTLEWNGSKWVLDPGDLNGIDNDGNGYIDDLIGWDFGSNDNNPMDDNGHGTHVAGTIAGDGSAGTQTGVAPGANIVCLKVLSSGFGNPSDVEEAISYAIEKNIDVLSLSIGWIYGRHYTPGSYNDPRAGFRYACELAIAAGTVICVAAGNEGSWSSPAVPHNIRTPGDVPSVITVGATNSSDVIASFSSKGPVTWSDVSVYGDYSYPPGLLKPDVSAPGVEITSTKLNGGYQLNSGTSMATPAVSGNVALLIQANPNLTHAQIKDILEKSSIDLGLTGKDPLYGSGRDEALQSTLLSLAYANKSSSYWASGYNNNHTIERGYSGKLHEVFHGGGEIFYRRSSNNGSTWELTTRLSNGNGSNEAPSIVAGYGDVLCVVWQRKINNYNYEIYSRFSSNMGTTWLNSPTPISVTVSWNQSNGNYGPGTTPVVASYFRGGSEGTPSFILVYAEQNGLYYRTAATYSSGWSSSNIVPGSSGSGSSIWHPSLASYNSQGYNVNLIYDDRWTNVYSQIFNESSGWASRVAISFVGSSNRNSSIAVDYTNNTLGVWSGWNGSNYTIRFRQGFANGTWSSWTKEWAVSGANSFFPLITYYNKGGSYP
jgi:serine protease AprX